DLLLEHNSVSLAHLAASYSSVFLFFQPLLASSSHPSSLTRIVVVGPAQLSVAYLRKLFGKDGLWTQPTLFGRGELPRMVQPMKRLRCQNAERVYPTLREDGLT